MDKIIKYNKLVRDKIPEIIKSQGKIPKTDVISGTEYFSALKNKLTEETVEFNTSETAEELADIMEVVFSLAAHIGITQKELEQIRLKKQLERGSFNNGIFLIETFDNN